MTDDWVGERMCLARAQLNHGVLQTVLGIDYVKEVDRRPQPSFELLDVVRAERDDLEIASTLPDDLVGVLVIDSGVMQGHPVLAPAVRDAQVFPDRLRQRVLGGPEDGDSGIGHGTAVAGIAVYNDVGECIAARSFQASAMLFSARVTDAQNQYDEEALLEHQLEEALAYFIQHYPSIKVVNISLGDSALVCSDDGHQFRFAAVIDELALRYRTGNRLRSICWQLLPRRPHP